MNHDKTAEYLWAHKMAEQEVKDGNALSYLTGYNREQGRYIELQTDQGWNPEPFWYENREPDYLGNNDSTPD